MTVAGDKSVQIAVIIPTRDRAEQIEATLELLPSCVPAEVEIIVVVNGSSDATPLAVQAAARHRPGIRCLELPIGNASAARNAGVACTDADILVFIDDDIRPCPGWFEALVRPLIDGRADVVVGAVTLGRQLTARTPSYVRAMYLASDDAMGSDDPFFTGCNSALRRTAFALGGGFDEELGPGGTGGREDIFLGMKLVARGQGMIHERSALVVHDVPPHRLTRQALLQRAASDGRSLGWISYHWGHASTRFARAKQLLVAVTSPVATLSSVGHSFPSRIELTVCSKRSMYRQLRVEHGRTRKYAESASPSGYKPGAP